MPVTLDEHEGNSALRRAAQDTTGARCACCGYHEGQVVQRKDQTSLTIHLIRILQGGGALLCQYCYGLAIVETGGYTKIAEGATMEILDDDGNVKQTLTGGTVYMKRNE